MFMYVVCLLIKIPFCKYVPADWHGSPSVPAVTVHACRVYVVLFLLALAIKPLALVLHLVCLHVTEGTAVETVFCVCRSNAVIAGLHVTGKSRRAP